MRRNQVIVALVGTLVLGVATPARADPAVPTTYRSIVTGLVPSIEGLIVEVVGGDAFLMIQVDPGVTVEVPGYQGEAYLRFEADGIVLANVNSPAYWLNDDRFGSVDLPPTAHPEAVPDWSPVATGGSYAWHDHRIHWMSPNPPPGVDEDRSTLIQTWEVPIVVDGQPVTVGGTLHWVPRQSPVPWMAAVLVVAAAAWFVRPLVSLTLAGLSALIFGLGQALTTPLGFASELLSFLPPLLALGLTVLGLVKSAQSPTLGGTAAIFLMIWAALRLSHLTMPVLPLPWDHTVIRAALAVVIGATLAALLRLYLVLRGRSPASP